MKVFDPFAGTKSWLKPFELRGHEVFSNDIDPKFDTDLHMDARDLSFDHLPWKPDMIIASCPCTAFSVGSFRHHFHATAPCRHCGNTVERVSGERWEHTTENGCRTAMASERPKLVPKSETGRLGLSLLCWTLDFIAVVQPRYFIIENPVAAMRRMPQLQHLERRSVTYCRYGMWYRKHTDLWGGFPESLILRPPCDAADGEVVTSSNELHNDVPHRLSPASGRPCHEKAERGSRLGTQGLSTEEAGRIPFDLALDVCLAAERDFARVAA